MRNAGLGVGVGSVGGEHRGAHRGVECGLRRGDHRRSGVCGETFADQRYPRTTAGQRDRRHVRPLNPVAGQQIVEFGDHRGDRTVQHGFQVVAGDRRGRAVTG
jgi:hypothetical protein